MERDDRKLPDDPTPIVGAPTDIAPVSRREKPMHEQTAAEDIDAADWNEIAASEPFKDLLKAKRRFIIPATIFFVIYYFALPYLVGYHPDLMQRKVWGEVNWAYLFALSQFFMAWVIALLYVRAAARHDRVARNIVDRHDKPQGGR